MSAQNPSAGGGGATSSYRPTLCSSLRGSLCSFTTLGSREMLRILRASGAQRTAHRRWAWRSHACQWSSLSSGVWSTATGIRIVFRDPKPQCFWGFSPLRTPLGPAGTRWNLASGSQIGSQVEAPPNARSRCRASWPTRTWQVALKEQRSLRRSASRGAAGTRRRVRPEAPRRRPRAGRSSGCHAPTPAPRRQAGRPRDARPAEAESARRTRGRRGSVARRAARGSPSDGSVATRQRGW